jgi:hypothetical protein
LCQVLLHIDIGAIVSGMIGVKCMGGGSFGGFW